MRYYMYRDERDGLWRWYLLSESGQSIARSMQVYFSEEQCRQAIEAVMGAGPGTPIDQGDTTTDRFEDVGLKKAEDSEPAHAQAPNEIPPIGR